MRRFAIVAAALSLLAVACVDLPLEEYGFAPAPPVAAQPPAATPAQPPTVTPVPPTATPAPPTATPRPPTATPVPPTATPTAHVAVSPTVTATVTAPGVVTPTVACPTDAAMRDALGFTAVNIKPVATGGGIPWEGCKWNWQSNTVGTNGRTVGIRLNLSANWQATVTRVSNDTPTVFYGPVDLPDVKGFTLRYRPAHNTPDNRWVNDPCELLKREHAFGQAPERGSLTYATVSGNVTCDQQAQPPAPPPPPALDASWLASNIGGNAEKWEPPTHAAGAWLFRDKGNPVSLKYPGKGKLDVWIGGPISITATNADRLNGQTFDEASYHP